MSMLREVLRDALHVLIFVDWACAVVLIVLGLQTAFFRADEYLERRGSLFSLRRPLPSEFSKEYYASYRRSVWLAVAFFAVLAVWGFLSWLDILIFGPTN
jgi:hypothetical protein